MSALDPFHDNRLDNLTGWPDMITTASIVRQVKQSVEIATAAGEDVHIISWPWLGTSLLGQYAVSGATVEVPGASTYVVPGVSIYKKTAGTDLAFNVTPAQGLVYPVAMHRGKGRLIGMGLELVNTTAPINRSGTIYTWRQPGLAEAEETMSYITSADVMQRASAFRQLATPPVNPASAMLIPGSRSWASEEGVYMVCPFEGDNPPLPPTQTAPMLSLTNPTLAVGYDNNRVVLCGTGTEAAPANRLVPMAETGIICTGNNVNSKFTLSVCWYYEEFPDVFSDVLTLATPSCEYDPVALELYTKVLNSLPIAVPSSWNTAGDWWWDIVTAIKDHAPKIGQMIGGAPGLVLGQAASSLAGWGRDRYLTAPGKGGSSVPERQRNRKADQTKTQPPRRQQQGNQNVKQKGTNRPNQTRKQQANRGRPPPLPAVDYK